MKKGFLVLAVVLLCVGMALPAAAAEGGQPGIEGKKVNGSGLIFDGELFVPLRAVAESTGYSVRWSEADNKITLLKPGQEIILSLTDRKVSVSGHQYFLMEGYKLIDGRTYVPQNFIADNLGFQVQWDKENDVVFLSSIQLNPVTVKTKIITSDTGSLLLNIQYPEIEGLADESIQSKINGTFEKIADQARAEGIKNGDVISGESAARNVRAETYFNYRIKYNQNDILSVVFQNYQYTGGAHGLTVQSSYTFNLKTGRQYGLNDLFGDDAGYVSLISREIKSQLAERGIMETLNPFEAIKADQDFYVNDKGIVIYFQQYEIMPYAYGIPEFTIGRASLAGLLKENIWPVE
ncbi:MAG TPA: hypothetical protein DEF36_01175 [Desulfotomaculum sp.]|nr:hypothetical protein [Desulfotomaculum sp.]